MRLFADLFSVAELKRFLVRFDFGERVLRTLPDGGSLDATIFTLVLELDRKGIVCERLFQMLEEEFPYRIQEIRKVAIRWKAHARREEPDGRCSNGE